MKQATDVKSARLLSIYASLNQGVVLSKNELSQRFGVTHRSIQRDIESLRCFLAEEGSVQDIVYDRKAKGYSLIGNASCYLNNSEVLAVCKILLESRSMVQTEMMPILEKLVACCVPPENQRAVQILLANEKHHYIAPHHSKPVLDKIWGVGQAISRHQVLTLSYEKPTGQQVERQVEPVGLLFSEYYFYLAAFLRDVDKAERFDNPTDHSPTIYRIDRIASLKATEEQFHPPYADRFEEGEFRKRTQFMFGGKLQTIRFRYTGPSIEAVLDRLPTAVIVAQDETGWDISAEVFGKGIDMWLRSQGEYVKI